MELSAFARQVLLSTDLDAKLLRPDSLTDQHPAPPLRITTPARPDSLQFAKRRTAPPMPSANALRDPAKRAIAHHIMANHELQALEVMASVLLAFPGAPGDFRSGLAKIMLDEQRHTRLHIQRARELGLNFGDQPVNGWIWTKALDFQSELEYVAGLPLVFEGANLDHSAELELAFRNADDRRSAAIMRAIHHDEIKHVQFGIHWLREWKNPELSDWDAWTQALHWPIRPSRARGHLFHRSARLEAGLSAEFVDALEHYIDELPQPD
jgi:uncharacterized ferritin-like protein (DUF455 family)